MQLAGLTNRGRERARNEDSFYIKAASELALMVVADGMGGHRAGNVASGLAVSHAEQLWAELDLSTVLTPAEAREIMSRFVRQANKLIIDEAENSAEKKGMGTTLTSGLLYGNHLTISHIGDSRAYLVHEGKIRLLTRDHSLLEHLIESGQVRPEEANSHPQRHVLTRALGTELDPEVDIIEITIENGSVLLFCTDGLTGMVTDHEILALSLKEADPHSLAESLIDLANSRGGYDNITVVAATGIGGQEK